MPALKHLNSIDYIVVVFFLAMVAGVGIFMSRYNRNTKDYFKAGGKLPWILSSISMFVSGFSAFMFVSASGFTYSNGVSAIYMFTSSFGAYWLGYFVYGKLWHRSRIDSPMEVLTRRYSQSTTYFYSIIAVVPNILLMGTLIYTLCIFISSALGFGTLEFSLGFFTLTGFELTLVGIGAVLLIYTVLGGLWAVAVTDTLQFIILFLMTVVVFPFSFMYLGDGSFVAGFKNLLDQAPDGYLDFSFGQISFVFIASYWIMNACGYNVNWHIGQRYYSIADERDTKKMAVMCAIFGLVAPLMWILPVMVARIVFPDIDSLWPELTAPSEASFVSLCLFILPNGFLGVVVSAILAASMSSADSTFNWLAAVVTKDVFVPLAKKLKHGKEPTDRNQLIVGKATVLTIGILAIFISLLFQKIGSSFDIYLKIYSITTPALLVPVMLGLVYRKTPWWSGMASASMGMLVTLIMNAVATAAAGLPLQRVADIFSEVQLSFYGIEYSKFEMNVFVGLTVSAFVFFLSSRWPNKKQADIARLTALDRDLKTPAYRGAEPIDKQSIQSYKVVALLSAIIGGLLVVLSFFAQGGRDFLINLLTGIGALLFSFLFFYLSKRAHDVA
jgi:Na+/proline symporter